MELVEEIRNLIELKIEGDYWDFKEMWHDNKASLLHDIFVWQIISWGAMPTSLSV